MSEIFISYARQDRVQVEPLAKALENCGWSVWWDPHIPTGKRFDDVIEQAIAEARCMIVVWSNNSVSSSYVRAEASEGAERQILFPVMIEEVRIPLAFRQIQTARLIDWRESVQHAGFNQLVKDISFILSQTQTPQPGGAIKSAPSSNGPLQLWRILHLPLFRITAALVLAALLITAATLILKSRQGSKVLTLNTNQTTIPNANSAENSSTNFSTNSSVNMSARTIIPTKSN